MNNRHRSVSVLQSLSFKEGNGAAACQRLNAEIRECRGLVVAWLYSAGFNVSLYFFRCITEIRDSVFPNYELVKEKRLFFVPGAAAKELTITSPGVDKNRDLKKAAQTASGRQSNKCGGGPVRYPSPQTPCREERQLLGL